MTPEAVVQVLTGREPYRWQSRLLGELLGGDVPVALDVPTGLGKTAVMGLWLAARALAAPEARAKLPCRLIYVVDRRAVVDQATAEAEVLRARLGDSETASAEIAALRRGLGLRVGRRLAVSTLRGQFADNREWLEDPVAPAIVVGTIDMIGSRLLFEGYGVSRGMRPAHAGLLGADTLVVIDEAHLVPPFEALVRAAAEYERPEPVPGMRVLALSATGAAYTDGRVFRLQPQDWEDAPVRRRLEAPKRLRVEETEDLVEALAVRAFELGERGKRVLVFCNSRDKAARRVEERLRELSAKMWRGLTTTALLVGGRRSLERDALTGRRNGDGNWGTEPDPVFRRFMAGEEGSAETPAFLVATSAGEVGVDLDADHMVCDLVPWERMVQRLGRVNRAGRDEAAVVDVFVARAMKKDLKDDVEDSIDSRISTLLAPFESDLWPTGEDGRRAAGPSALLDLKADEGFADLARAATTPEPLRPALTLPLIEAWSMTSLDEHPGRPRVEPWLRGWIDKPPQARVVWRRVLPVRKGERPDRRLLREFFAALPPHVSEGLEAETYKIAGVARARADAVRKGADGPDKALNALAAVTLDTRGELEEVWSLDQLAEADATRLEARLAGRTLLLAAGLGGLSAAGLLDDKASFEPPTLDAKTSAGESEIGWSEERLKDAGRRLTEVAADAGLTFGWVREAGWPCSTDDGDDDGERLEWRVERLKAAPAIGDAARSTPQALTAHHDWTGEEADRIARALQLPEAQRSMLVVAARAHDLGKDRALWQHAMGAAPQDRPLAKTDGRRANPALLKIQGRTYRHEFGSLRDAESALAGVDEGLRDLARHLIVAHHGWAHPVIAPVDPDEPPSTSEARAREAALRFARLQREWGPWGLAWWETLLRAADWAASRRLAKGEGA